jgi:O-antigen ligase
LLGSKNDIEINNFSSRENIWKNAIIMFNSNDFNWIIGNGWCTFPLWYQKYFSIYLGAHNFYISYLYTTGLIGVIILITYFINLIKVLTKHSMFYFLLILIPFFSMLTTNWEYRRWWFLMGLFIYKLSDLKKDSNLNP